MRFGRSPLRTLARVDLPAWENAAREADIAVEAAISAILEPHARQLVDRAQEIRLMNMPIRQPLCALFNDNPSGQTGANYWADERGQKPLEAVRNEVKEFLSAFNAVEDKDEQGDPWRSARERLRVDPFCAAVRLRAADALAPPFALFIQPPRQVSRTAQIGSPFFRVPFQPNRLLLLGHHTAEPPGEWRATATDANERNIADTLNPPRCRNHIL
jgi:hypothetical protein